MTMNRNPLLPLALGLVTALAGLSAPQVSLAAQGEGTLAQAPLNLGSQVAPAFLMGVDDSGSMTFEVLFKEDEQAYWGNTTACLQGQASCPNGFFDDAGDLRTSGRRSYYHIIQNGIRLDKNGNNAVGTGNGYRLGIPPLDLFGFARSPDMNGQYFNPEVTYRPWQNADGSFWPDTVVTAARSDPRANGSAGTRGPNPIVTYNFTANETRTNDYFAFRLQPGMLLPADTQYYLRGARHGNGCGGLGTTAATRDSWQTIATGGHLVTATDNIQYGGGGNDRGGGCEVHISYFPAVVYLREDSPPPPGFDLSKRVLVPNAGGPGVPLFKYELRAGNFISGYAEVIQNFANWYSYYGNRNRAMVSSMTQSLQPINRMRIGYFAINKRSGNNPGMTGGDVVMRDMAAPAQKANLYANVFTLPADGGTPNRSAVVYMGDQFRRDDANAPVQLACQKNAGMLFTDGYTNESHGSVGNAYRNIGDTDGSQPAPIGGNTNGNTIADIAYSFYANNLRPDITPVGKVPVVDACRLPNGTIDPSADLRLDCQPNLHMNFYGITLGTPGAIHGVDLAATADPYANNPNWSVTGTQNLNPRNVDDIWHATLNTRGKYINAKRPTDVTTAMREILQAVGEGTGPSGSIALTGARVGDASSTVIPEYASENNGTDWYGRLRAESVALTPTGDINFTELWEASAQLPLPGTRRILFGSPSTSVTPPVNQFLPANLSLGALCSGPLSRCSAAEITGLGVNLTQAVNFLRGDQALEATQLRERTTVLGDIVNSSPAISSPKDNYGYRNLRGATAADVDPYNYQAYMTTKETRRRMVYVGANDGMLHAFDGETGVETFAYVPSVALGHMGNLLFPYVAADGNDQKFQHRYFVDGPVTVSDARIGAGWRTVLVGTAGAGGRGVYALDVSAPASFGASNVLWEVSSSVAGQVGQRIGHVLGKPVVVPTRIGTGTPSWKAVFGNGFGSTSGLASLFVVDVATGTTTTIQATETGGPATPNGLGSVVLVDRWISNSTVAGSDGYADTAYGGDLHGNIWKFDLRDNTVANGGLPIFTASVGGERQPITGGLEIASGPGGGVLVYFGTGSYSFQNDATDQSVQSLYAVHDRPTPTFITVDRANLASQVLGVTLDGLRTLTGAPVNYVTQRGWYMDLVTVDGGTTFLKGERFVGNPRLQSGLVLFPTFEPGGIAGDPCAVGGSNWLYALNAVSGGAGLSGLREGSPTGAAAGSGTAGTLLDTTGTIPIKDVAVLLPPPPAGVDAGADAAAIAAALAQTCDLIVSVPGAPPYYLPRACGRQSWRQIR